jgi:glycosyltransferase involved in cell wall biosynthesis
MINLPLVSIIIPVFNGQDYILDSVKSAIDQTYTNIEVIVVNDGSNDNTELILQPYLDRIRYFKKENGGVSSALNMGIKMMKGEYFSWLSHDDLYKRNRIERLISFIFTQKKFSSIVYTDYSVKYNRFPINIRKKLDHKLLADKPKYALYQGNLNGVTMLIPKDVLIRFGDFDESLRCVQDYDYWSRLIDEVEFLHLNKALSITRIHAKQDSRNHNKCLDEVSTFWINLLENISEDTMISYEGSRKNFLIIQRNFFRKASLEKVVDYIDKVL